MPKYIYRVARQDLAVADLVLEAKVDEGFEVIDIGIIGGAAGLVAQLIIGNEVMTGFPCDNGAENIVPVPGLETNQNPLLSTLLKKFPALPMYKVSSGERLVISSGGAAGVAKVFYRQFSGAEIPAKTVDGASEGPSRLFFSHGKSEVTVGIGATVDVIANIELNPVGVPGFPFAELVPVNTEFDLLGFCCQLGAGSGANVTFDGLRLWKLQESILVRDQGFIIPGLYPYSRDNVDKPMFTLPTPLTFLGQEEFKVEVRTTNAGAGAQLSQIFFTFAFLMRFLK
jgi:hypothetical protein